MVYTLDTLSQIPKGSFGVIGFPVEHSMSPFIHSRFAPDKNYIRILLKKEELKDALPILSSLMDGFNITIPHKEEIIPYLDEIDETAKLLGAVNTVKIKNGKLIGYNTDLFGFLTSVQESNISLKDKKILLLGAGGAAKTMGYAAVTLGGQLYIHSRTFDKSKELSRNLSELTGCPTYPLKEINELHPDIVLNATPCGMWKKTGFSPLEDFNGIDFVFDSIYNPVMTKLLLSANRQGIKTMNGSLMLSAQAAKAREVWDDKEIPMNKIVETSQEINQNTGKKFPVNIVLTGFMGSGKTTVGKGLAKLAGIPFYDLDAMVEKGEGKKISELFKEGEPVFRELESRYLEEFLNEKHGILSLGGGTVCFHNNMEIIKNSPAFVFYLKSDFEVIMQRVGNSKNRPLMKQSREDIEELFLNREKYYISAADFIINGNRTPKEVSADIYQIIKEIF